jgi:hypothetical protein
MEFWAEWWFWLKRPRAVQHGSLFPSLISLGFKSRVSFYLNPRKCVNLIFTFVCKLVLPLPAGRRITRNCDGDLSWQPRKRSGLQKPVVSGIRVVPGAQEVFAGDPPSVRLRRSKHAHSDGLVPWRACHYSGIRMRADMDARRDRGLLASFASLLLPSVKLPPALRFGATSRAGKESSDEVERRDRRTRMHANAEQTCFTARLIPAASSGTVRQVRHSQSARGGLEVCGHQKHAAGVLRPRLRYELLTINFPLPLTGEVAASDVALVSGLISAGLLVSASTLP